MLYDSLGVCLFAHAAVRNHHDLFAEMVSGLLGIETNAKAMRQSAIQAIQKKKILIGGGTGPATDRLPEIFCQEESHRVGLCLT